MSLSGLVALPPDQAILKWLNDSDADVVALLVRNFIFMTSSRSEDFALDEDKALQHFQHIITKTDFPQRRLARVLNIRGLFSFLLEYNDQVRLHVGSGTQVMPIQVAHWLQARRQWQGFCSCELADSRLLQWLEVLRDGH